MQPRTDVNVAEQMAYAGQQMMAQRPCEKNRQESDRKTMKQPDGLLVAVGAGQRPLKQINAEGNTCGEQYSADAVSDRRDGAHRQLNLKDVEKGRSLHICSRLSARIKRSVPSRFDASPEMVQPTCAIFP